MKWNKETSKNNLSFIASAYNLGFFVSSLLFIQMRNISPHKKSIIVKLLLFLSSISITLPFAISMIISRFIQGFSVGILLSSSNSNIYQSALPEHRKRALPMLTVSFAFAFILVTLLSLFDNEGPWIWRVIFWAQGAVALLDFIIEGIFLHKIHPVMFEIKAKGREEAKKMLNTYLYEETSERIIQEFERALGRYNVSIFFIFSG